MTEEKVHKAKLLLDLPRMWTLTQVAEYLLEQFHKAYPDIRAVFYEGMVEEVMTTGKLVSEAIHYCDVENLDVETFEELQQINPRGWVRHCFGNPKKSKGALNSYISHPPQSLNAQTLNKAFLAVFYEIAMNPKYAPHFKLIAQIHDSILFQYRVGHEYLCEMVRERMEIPVTIKGYDGNIRTFTVPAGIKSGIEESGGDYSAVYWSETE